MSTYTVEKLAQDGAKHAFALLLQHIRCGEPFVTYGAIAKFLEEKLIITKIFPTHIGHVAGHLMESISKESRDAPLINALVTRPNGLPGSGFGGFYDEHLCEAGECQWANLVEVDQLKVVADIRAEVRGYSKWDAIYKELYGESPPKVAKPKLFTEKDGNLPDTGKKGGSGESNEHKALKKWACDNPQALKIRAGMTGEIEASLLSGDLIDVLFTDGKSYVAVEVKSIHSGDDDWQRGIYQCVKYRSVLEAQELPVKVNVRTILLTEEDLPYELKDRARLLGVKLKVHELHARRLR